MMHLFVHKIQMTGYYNEILKSQKGKYEKASFQGHCYSPLKKGTKKSLRQKPEREV